MNANKESGMKVKRVGLNDKCQYEKCRKWATSLAYNRTTKQIGKYCKEHATITADIDDPEYHHTCENCGCELPIN